MGRGKRVHTGHRVGDAVDWHGARGSDDERWDLKDPEDDPLHDLRSHEDDMRNPAGDDYIWPEMNDENEEDD